MKEREIKEDKIRQWVRMWLSSSCDGIEKLFDKNAYYSESHGPEYHGIAQLTQWFTDWNTQNKVTQWEATSFFHDGQTTVTEWHFEWVHNGRKSSHEGASIIEWSRDGKIYSIKDFGSVSSHTLPYGV